MAFTGHKHTSGARLKVSLAMRRRWRSVEGRAKLNRAQFGRKCHLETREKIRQGNLGKKLSLEHRAKLSRAGLGRKLSLEHRLNISRAQIGVKRPKHVTEKMRIARARRVIPFRDTSIEKQLHNALLGIGVNFVTHAQIKGIGGPPRLHQFDVLIPVLRIAIEADGCYWHCCPKCRPLLSGEMSRRVGKPSRDRQIDVATAEAGWQIIRLWEHEINGGNFSKLGGIIPQGVQ